MALANTATTGTTSPTPLRPVRCTAARPDDPNPCDGPHAVVRVVDQHGGEATGCVRHAAILYASLVGSRVYPTPGHGRAVLEVYYRAQTLRPFSWPSAA